MFVSPRRSLADEALPPRCVQFVVDTSGSMAGPKMLQAKAALQAFLKTLSPRDRFQIVTFATEASPFFTAPRTVDEAAFRRFTAKHHIFCDRERRKEFEGLKDHADVGSQLRQLATFDRQLSTVDRDRAGVDGLEAVDRAAQG